MIGIVRSQTLKNSTLFPSFYSLLDNNRPNHAAHDMGAPLSAGAEAAEAVSGQEEEDFLSLSLVDWFDDDDDVDEKKKKLDRHAR